MDIRQHLGVLDAAFLAFIETEDNAREITTKWKATRQSPQSYEIMHYFFENHESKFFTKLRNSMVDGKEALCLYLDGMFSPLLDLKGHGTINTSRLVNKWQRLDDTYLQYTPSIAAFHVSLTGHCPTLYYNADAKCLHAKSYCEDTDWMFVIMFEERTIVDEPDEDYANRCTLSSIPRWMRGVAYPESPL